MGPVDAPGVTVTASAAGATLTVGTIGMDVVGVVVASSPFHGSAATTPATTSVAATTTATTVIQRERGSFSSN